MAGVKILVLACLLTLALATPLSLLGGKRKCHGKHLRGGGDSDGGSGGGGGLLGPVVGGGGKGGVLGGVLGKKGLLGKPLGGLLSGTLGPLGDGLTKITGNAKSILKDLSLLKIPGLVDDVMNLLINLGYAVGNILNGILPGTGTAISNLLVGLFKLLLCTLGSPGLTGSLLNDRRPGFDNTFVCSPSFGTKCGCKSYDGGNNPQDVIDFYNLANIEADLLVAINKLTNGLGLDGLSGNIRVILDLVLQLVGISKKSKHTNKDFVSVIVNLTSILGAIGNSVKAGLGDKLVVDLLNGISRALNKKILGGIDLKIYIKTVKKNISRCKRDTLLGAVLGGKGGKGGLGGVVGGVLKTVGGVVKGVLGKGGLLSGIFGPLGKGLTKITGNVKNILDDLSRLKIPGTVDDVFNLLINLVRTVGGILNAILPGTGTAVARLVVGLLKVLLCSLGSPGLTGKLLNDRRPGFGNTFVCAPDYGTQCGLKPYRGGNSRDDIIDFYNLANIEVELNVAINKLTKGVGVKGLKGNLKNILQWVLELVGLVNKSKHTNKDFVLVIVNLSTILGGVANSVKDGYGVQLSNDLLSHLSLILNAKILGGIDLKSYITTVKRNVSRCKRDRLYGTVNYVESKSSTSSVSDESSSTSSDTVTTSDDSNTVTSSDNSSTVTSDTSNDSTTSSDTTSNSDSSTTGTTSTDSSTTGTTSTDSSTTGTTSTDSSTTGTTSTDSSTTGTTSTDSSTTGTTSTDSSTTGTTSTGSSTTGTTSTDSSTTGTTSTGSSTTGTTSTDSSTTGTTSTDSSTTGSTSTDSSTTGTTSSDSTTTNTSSNDSSDSDSTSSSSNNDSSSNGSSSTKVVKRKASLGSFLSRTLGIVGKKLKKTTGNVNSILQNLLKLKVSTVDDVFYLLITIGHFVGNVVNRLLPGVGTAVSNLLVGIFKILLCVVGSPGLTGSLLGNRRPAVCSPSFGTSCGLPAYNGGYSNAQDLIDFYALANIEADLLVAINKLTNGAGLSSLTGNVRVILQWVLELAGLCKKSNYSNKDLVSIIVNLTTILGGIANSVQADLGDGITEEIFNSLSRVVSVKVIGIDLKFYIKTVKKNISRCRQDNLNGILIDINVNVGNSQTSSSSSDSSNYNQSQSNQSQNSQSQTSQSQTSQSQANQSQTSQSEVSQSDSSQSQNSQSTSSQSQTSQAQTAQSQSSQTSQSNVSQSESNQSQSSQSSNQSQSSQSSNQSQSSQSSNQSQSSQSSNQSQSSQSSNQSQASQSQESQSSSQSQASQSQSSQSQSQTSVTQTQTVVQSTETQSQTSENQTTQTATGC